ncbi:MAG: TAXI family TRAP transporter solute-binding subunit [Candidatus Binatia bacterium]
MTKNISLSIATASKGRAAIAASIAVAFYTRFRLPEPSQITVAMGYGRLAGIDAPVNVDRGKFHFGFANPSGVARMAYLGRGSYKKKMALRAIGVFPSWDRLVFAVRADTGIHSIEEIKATRFPLRVSTRMTGSLLSTLFIIDEVLKGYGFSLSDIESWGGKIMRVSNPSSLERGHHLRSSEADAVFDEGLKSWGDLALESGMRFLPIRADVLKRLERLGFTSAPVTNKEFSGLKEPITTVDFSGWPLLCRSDLAPEFAYKMAEAIDSCHEQIPVDHFDRRPMTMRDFCQGSDGGPLTIPLHRGAKKYYERNGYL